MGDVASGSVQLRWAAVVLAAGRCAAARETLAPSVQCRRVKREVAQPRPASTASWATAFTGVPADRKLASSPQASRRSVAELPCRLTPPSSGRPKACFAAFGPPLMSNVRPHALRSASGESELQRSHVIPEFYRSLYDDKHRLQVLSTLEDRGNWLEQKGLRERLLCASREAEDFRLGGLRGSTALQGGVPLDDPSRRRHRIVSGLDYLKFRLFQLSVLWAGQRVNIAFLQAG